jgi:hypothetical protein
MENIIISDHLRDLANQRIDEAEALYGEADIAGEYHTELIEFIKHILINQS